MNGLDAVLLLVLGVAAVRGFFRGFIVEVCSLFGLVLGIWAGVHLNARAAAWMGLDAHQEVLSFVVVFLAALAFMHLIGRALTRVIDLAQLGLPNKIAGVLFGLLRSAFVLSVVLNLLSASDFGGLGTRVDEAASGSVAHGPVKAFAPMVLPVLRETKWVERAIDRITEEAAADRSLTLMPSPPRSPVAPFPRGTPAWRHRRCSRS